MNGTKVDAGLGCMSFLFPAMWVVQEGRKYQPLIAAASMLLFPDMWAVQQERKEHMRQEARGSPFKSVLLSVGAD